ncbi:MAG: hypothetical protein EPO26_04720 [Chloroflexota bacterium]|nr:MAG: hypothetical protein EPO26_04720 [Chloroflexota bacterium]
MDGHNADDTGRVATTPDADGVYHVIDPAIDVDAIVHAARAKRAAGSSLAGYFARLDAMGAESTSLRAERDIALHLLHVNEELANPTVGGAVRGGPGIVGAILLRLRAPLHQLARYYAELALGRAHRMVSALATVTRLLAERSSATADDIVALRSEVARLQTEVDELKRRHT